MRILEHYDDGERRIDVVERASDGARLYYENGVLYTEVDATGHNRLVYIDAMGRVLKGARDVLVLGSAGGALAGLLSRRGCAVTAVDNLAAAFDLARRWFFLPDAVACVCADAIAMLRAADHRWDAIAVDIFRGVHIPEAFLSPEVAALIVSRLAPGGAVVWNVADGPASPTTARIVDLLKAVGLAPFPLQVIAGDEANTLVVCRSA